MVSHAVRLKGHVASMDVMTCRLNSPSSTQFTSPFVCTCDLQLALPPAHFGQDRIPLALVHSPALVQALDKHSLPAQHRHRSPAGFDGYMFSMTC